MTTRTCPACDGPHTFANCPTWTSPTALADAPTRCGSCNGAIDPRTGECACSD